MKLSIKRKLRETKLGVPKSYEYALLLDGHELSERIMKVDLIMGANEQPELIIHASPDILDIEVGVNPKIKLEGGFGNE